MKIKALLLITGSILAGILYAGLPEQPVLRDLKAGPEGTEDFRDSRPQFQAGESPTLDRQQAIVIDRLNELGREIDKESPASIKLGQPLDGKFDGAPGLTVYIETGEMTRTGRQQNGWTAIHFHDAGIAPDGSHQAVMTIHPNLSVTPSSTKPESIPVGSANWQ